MFELNGIGLHLYEKQTLMMRRSSAYSLSLVRTIFCQFQSLFWRFCESRMPRICRANVTGFLGDLHSVFGASDYYWNRAAGDQNNSHMFSGCHLCKGLWSAEGKMKEKYKFPLFSVLCVGWTENYLFPDLAHFDLFHRQTRNRFLNIKTGEKGPEVLQLHCSSQLIAPFGRIWKQGRLYCQCLGLGAIHAGEKERVVWRQQQRPGQWQRHGRMTQVGRTTLSTAQLLSSWINFLVTKTSLVLASVSDPQGITKIGLFCFEHKLGALSWLTTHPCSTFLPVSSCCKVVHVITWTICSSKPSGSLNSWELPPQWPINRKWTSPETNSSLITSLWQLSQRNPTQITHFAVCFSEIFLRIRTFLRLDKGLGWALLQENCGDFEEKRVVETLWTWVRKRRGRTAAELHSKLQPLFFRLMKERILREESQLWGIKWDP